MVLWDLFLMKKLIKSGVCGSVNSALMHCLQKNGSTIAAEKKKKKKKLRKRRHSTNKCYPN